MKYILAPSILSADFSILGKQIEQLTYSGITHIHFDVMDGNFVPNISFGVPVLRSLHNTFPALYYDVHMMVKNPALFIKDFADAGADMMTVHQETCSNLNEVLQLIRNEGMECGVVLNPPTPLETIFDVLPICDKVLIMSVYAGFGGQQFIPEVLDKISQLNDIRRERSLDFSIQVDGGINSSNIKSVVESGADDIVAGSAVFKGDISANITTLINAVN